jgi:hypothetical protein
MHDGASSQILPQLLPPSTKTQLHPGVTQPMALSVAEFATRWKTNTFTRRPRTIAFHRSLRSASPVGPAADPTAGNYIRGLEAR